MSSPFLMRLLSQTDGIVDLDVPDPYERSVLGGYWNDVRLYLEGQPYDLRQYAGLTVAGHSLEIDLDAIEYLANSGELEFEDIYSVR